MTTLNENNKKETPDKEFHTPTLTQEKEIIKKRRENGVSDWSDDYHDRGRYL